MPIDVDAALWVATVARARRELATLPAARRTWLVTQTARIGALQSELDRLFREIDGPTICTDCLGGCCSRGKHHVTLTNLLACLLAAEEPPEPDFNHPCPLLGPQGCRLPATRRPFNCVIFLCDAVDRQLSDLQRAHFARVEAELRAAYHAVAEHCPGASLRGLLIAAGQLEDRPLLTKP